MKQNCNLLDGSGRIEPSKTIKLIQKVGINNK